MTYDDALIDAADQIRGLMADEGMDLDEALAMFMQDLREVLEDE